MVAVDDFMQSVLGDEGWQEGLGQDVIEAANARLEAMLPEGAQLDDARAQRLRHALRALNGLSTARAAGKLTDAMLVDEVLTLAGGQ